MLFLRDIFAFAKKLGVFSATEENEIPSPWPGAYFMSALSLNLFKRLSKPFENSFKCLYIYESHIPFDAF